MTDYKLTDDGLYAYRWPRASVTADAVLFAEKEGQMYVLLIQRGNEPYKGYWAFPGGFLNMDETVAHCAERELEEETGIVLTGMQLVGIYSDVERDPRGRVITAAYAAMTTMPEATAADDAAAAKWWPLNELPPLAFDQPTIEGHTIKEYKGLVSGEVIFGMNFLKDFGASLRDFFGGRTDSYEKAMLEGRETAQKEMRERAEKLGANAIVGVSFGYETMGQANSMIMISISGTAVVID